MHEQIFISGVWHSGTSLIAEIAKMNGYDLGRATNSKNDNNFAWRGPLNSLDSSSGYFTKDYDDASVKGILEKSWPFDTVDKQENELFKDSILKSRSHPTPGHNCCKLPGLSLMTPHIASAFPKAPIIHVIRNPIDISLSRTDNYFLDRLVVDKVSREPQEWDFPAPNIIKYLFFAIGGLEWTKIEFLPASIHIGANRKKIYWNILYALRWVLMQERLRIDIKKHNVQNHHIIKFENLITGPQRRTEIEKLRNILGVEGKLKMPLINQSKAYKYESFISDVLPNSFDDTEETIAEIYHLCNPYLEEFGYERVSEFMEKQGFINA